jgi:hypothetical protein
MNTALGHLLRLFLALAMGVFGLVPATGEECRPSVARAECPCCPMPDASCCAAPTDGGPAIPASVAVTQNQQVLRDAITPHAPLLHVLPMGAMVVFPKVSSHSGSRVTPQARRSLLCVRTV